MDCVHAIEQGDSREIMLLKEFYVKQWNDNMCLSAYEDETT